MKKLLASSFNQKFASAGNPRHCLRIEIKIFRYLISILKLCSVFLLDTMYVLEI